MSMQNLWVSKCKNDTLNIYKYIFLLYKWCIYLWYFDVKYVWFTFKLNSCNYHDVILNKIMRFLCITHSHSHMSFKTMFHLFEYLKYWIFTNIVHINHSKKFLWFLYELIKIGFYMKFIQFMKLDKFVMLVNL